MGPTPLFNLYYFLLSFNLTTVGPHVSFDQADVAIDLVPPVSHTSQHCVTDPWTPLVRFDLDRTPLTRLHHADVVLTQ